MKISLERSSTIYVKWVKNLPWVQCVQVIKAPMLILSPHKVLLR